MNSKRNWISIIKTNNQELLIRKQKGKDATSKCIEFQKTSLIKCRFQKEFIWRGQGYDCKWDFINNTKYNFIKMLKEENKWNGIMP